MREHQEFSQKYKDYNVVLFDGYCNFCEASVKFIIAHDKEKKIHFIPQSSKDAQLFIKENKLEELDTIIFFSKNKIYTFSDAALEIAKYLDGWYKYFYIFRYLPKAVRDMAYKIVAHIRYNIFGKKESCMIPTDDLKSRFLDNSTSL